MNILTDIDGLEGMKLTFGIIAVEGKDNQEKDAKVIKVQINLVLFLKFFR